MKLLPILILAVSLHATPLQSVPFSGSIFPESARHQRELWEARICGFNTSLHYNGVPSFFDGCGSQPEPKIDLYEPESQGYAPSDVIQHGDNPAHQLPVSQTPEPGGLFLVPFGLLALRLRRVK